MSDDKINVVGTNIREKATVIWNVANHLFGYFKPHEYGLVILPMTVVKRFHRAISSTTQASLTLTSCLPTQKTSKPTSATILPVFLLTYRTCCPNSISTQ